MQAFISTPVTLPSPRGIVSRTPPWERLPKQQRERLPRGPLGQSDRVLRERVAYLLWVMAQRVE